MEPKRKSFLRRINPILWGVPICTVVATLFFPLRPLVQQAMVGVILVWLYVSLLFTVQP